MVKQEDSEPNLKSCWLLCDDRQIRLWGKTAQKRMGEAKILVFGLRGLSVEICKNIVLAGEDQTSSSMIPN